MKKVLIIALALIMTSLIFANEQRDFRFIEELYQRDNLDFAQAEIEKFQDKYPDSDYLMKLDYYEAMIVFFQNNFAEADAKFLVLEKNSDQEIKPLVILALIQSKFFLDDYVESEKYADFFLKNYQNHSSRGEAYYWKGRIALQRENIALAEQYFNEATKSGKSSMLNYLGFQIKLKQKKLQDAQAILDSTYHTYEDEFSNQIVLEWLDHLYQNLNYSAIIRDSHYKIPTYSRLHSNYAIIIGQAYYQVKRYDESIRILNTIQPTTDVKQFHIALAYKAKGDISLASTIFSELAKTSDTPRIQELSFFEMINSSIAVPVGNEADIARIKQSNKDYSAQLSEFIQENPESNYLGNAYYLKGFIYYLNENYESALDWFLQANSTTISNDTSEKLLFLIGDIYFQTSQKSRAISLFNYYKELYPQGRYYDEVLYKIGLTYFDSGVFAESNSALLELAKKYPNYKHISTAYFYLGEINTVNNNLDVAIDWFSLALPNSTDPNAIWMRISEVYYLQGRFQDSWSALNNIPVSPLYNFRVNLIRGNILYNQKDYNKAIESYQKASNQAVSNEDISLITSRLGWTYYLKGDFTMAERTFRTLSNFSSTSEDYLILAGNSALNGRRFNDAISLFKEFLLTYPVSTKTNYVRLNLGDAYYNLKQYKTAFDAYAEILNNNPDSKELKNALLGLKWTVLNHKDRDYRSDLATLANKIKDNRISQTLTQITLLYENETEQWEDVINTAESLLKDYPQDNQNKVINQTLALAYTKRNQYEKADSLYANLTLWHKDAELFSAWSKAFLTRQDTTRAIEVLDDALKLTNELDIWFKSLELKVATNHPSFEASHKTFMAFADGLSKDYGQLLLYEWKLKNKQAIDLDYLNIQASSTDDKIASLAYYLIGLDSFIKQDYESTALNMMRVTYLFPDYSELNRKAAYNLILAQHYLGHKDKAQQNFDLYHSSLPDWQSSNLRNKLFK